MITDDAFKQIMRRWAATVTVVTTKHGEQIHGLTATSFTSLAMNPPSVLVCVNRNAKSHDLIEQSGIFCVNILSAESKAISDRFAGRMPMEERFSGLEHRSEATGAPVLKDALAYMDCRLKQAIVAADHTIFIGHVEAGAVQQPDAAPLLYYSGKYHRLGDSI